MSVTEAEVSTNGASADTSSSAKSSDRSGSRIDPKIDRELRIAVTMNGGVSLAVYIGGVAHELDRFTRQAGGYFELLQKFGYTATPPVIDIITGTSAGGINAAALALAQANAEGDLGMLKELWIHHGQIGDLLREPFQRGPASLLKGDDYFYPQIRRAFQRLTKNYVRAMDRGASDQVRPVDLTIPATLLTPVELELSDYLGTAVVQPQHAGLFQFRGGTADPGSDDGPTDMFSPRCIANGTGETVEALALAARASAGFPAAFEPTFIPVRRNANPADGRPNMAAYADWADFDRADDLSRFAVDGGVLANTPTRPALDGIRRREVTNTMVRRLLILVHPHAEYVRDIKIVADNALHPPTLFGALAGVAGASGSVGSRKYVEEIKQHNELALQWRNGRQAVMDHFSACDLETFLGQNDKDKPAWKLFRQLRLRRGAYVSASNVRMHFDTPFAKLIDYALEMLKKEDGPEEGLAFLPALQPQDDEASRHGWRWGLNLAVGVASQTTELLRQLIMARAYISDDVWDQIGEPAKAAWTLASNKVVELERLVDQEQKSEAARDPDAVARRTGNGFERERILACLRENLKDYNNEMMFSDDPVPHGRGRQAMLILRKVVQEFLVVIEKLDACDTGTDSATRNVKCETKASLLRPTNPLRRVKNYNELMKRMLQIEIIAFLTAEHDGSDGSVPTVPIDFVQLSAHVEQDFAAGYSADDKLAGMSLHRFGAFLKRSWRANDWIWGRLDAVKILMLVVLTPEIIRGYGGDDLSAKRVVDHVARAAFHDDLKLYDKLSTGSLKYLLSRAVEEVERAFKGDDAPMEALASLAAYGYQVGVAEQDVPWLAGTIRDDRDDGAIGAETAQFLNEFEHRKDSPDGYDLLVTFAESKIGQEALAEQMPSDLMIRTSATAAATAVTALSAEESGLGFARPATKAARGLVALPYWVLVALSGRGRIARASAGIVLSLGVVATALSLITDVHGLPAKLMSTFGVASLLTLFAYAALRTQSIVHGAALLGLFIPLISYAVVGGNANQHHAISGITRVSVIWIILLLAWVLVVANISSNTRSPWTALVRAVWVGRAFCIANKRALIDGVVVVVAAGLIGFFGRHLIAQWYRGSWLSTLITALVRAFQHRPWDGDVRSWTTVSLVAAAVAGFFIAWRKSVRFKRSSRTDPPTSATAVDPAWLATAWSPVYGLIYVAIGVLLVPLLDSVAPNTEWDWAKVASIVSLTLGLFFSLVVVSVVPYLREKRLIRRLVTHFEPKAIPQAPKDIVAALNELSEYTAYLSRGGTCTRMTIEEGKPTELMMGERKPARLTIEKGEQGKPTQLTVEEVDPIRLTRHGKRVQRHARRISARRARTRASAGA